MNKLQKIMTHEFESELVEETAYSQKSIGKHKSEMILWARDGHHFIEWIVDDIAEVEIGLTINHRTVIDYDGVFELNPEAIKLIKKAGYGVDLE